MRLRWIAEQEEIDGVRSEGLHEIVPSVSCMDESTSLTQSTCADVFFLPSLWIQQTGTCISHDVGKFVT